MKHNWTYKKLGEVANIYQPKTLSTEMLITDGKYLVYGANGVIGRYSEYNHEEKELLVTCRGATCGTLNVSEPFSWINGNAMVVHISDNQVLFDFLKYVLKGLDWSLIITGAAQPQITRQNLAPTKIPIPSLDEQQAIVRELDGINRLIDLQEEQLREYDRLAQSLFYTTFGEEEKWQKATLKDICSSIIRGPFGSALKKDFFVPKSSDTYKVYEQKHAIQKNATIGAYYITKEKFEELKRFEVFPEDIIMSCSGTIGELFVIPLDAEKGVMNQALLKFHLNELATIPYFLFVMEYVKSKMTVQGCGLQNIGSVKEICKIDFPLPPLALQQTFAAQIEAIEQQKALIRKSLEDTRTLLAARMQYYFNS